LCRRALAQTLLVEQDKGCHKGWANRIPGQQATAISRAHGTFTQHLLFCKLHAPHPHPPQVRAGSLQELVYKQGAAGINKATVSIVFHNDDPKNGPSGYEDKETITVTRQVRRPKSVVLGALLGESGVGVQGKAACQCNKLCTAGTECFG
jgi:hypothetical protein